MRKILITRPLIRGDDATSHTFYWATPIIKLSRELGYDLTDYQKNNVTYVQVSKVLKEYNPNLYIHFGHACPANLIGQGECIITNGNKNFNLSKSSYLQKYMYRMSDDIFCDMICNSPSNVELLSNKIVITYSCHSAKNLGMCAIKKGAKAYVGFDDYLIFMVDSKGSEKIFTDCLLTFTYSMLNGDTLRMAREKTLNKFDEYIRKYKNVKYLAMLLLWDKMAFKVMGPDELTIFT